MNSPKKKSHYSKSPMHTAGLNRIGVYRVMMVREIPPPLYARGDIDHPLHWWCTPPKIINQLSPVFIARTESVTFFSMPTHNTQRSRVFDGKGNTDSVESIKNPVRSWCILREANTINAIDEFLILEGQSFPELMQKNVLGPLGMSFKHFWKSTSGKYHAIAATAYRGDGTEVEGKWPIYPEMAAAGLWTTHLNWSCGKGNSANLIKVKRMACLKSSTVNES